MKASKICICQTSNCTLPLSLCVCLRTIFNMLAYYIMCVECIQGLRGKMHKYERAKVTRSIYMFQRHSKSKQQPQKVFPHARTHTYTYILTTIHSLYILTYIMCLPLRYSHSIHIVKHMCALFSALPTQQTKRYNWGGNE